MLILRVKRPGAQLGIVPDKLDTQTRASPLLLALCIRHAYVFKVHRRIDAAAGPLRRLSYINDDMDVTASVRHSIHRIIHEINRCLVKLKAFTYFTVVSKSKKRFWDHNTQTHHVATSCSLAEDPEILSVACCFAISLVVCWLVAGFH